MQKINFRKKDTIVKMFLIRKTHKLITKLISQLVFNAKSINISVKKHNRIYLYRLEYYYFRLNFDFLSKFKYQLNQL